MWNRLCREVAKVFFGNLEQKYYYCASILLLLDKTTFWNSKSDHESTSVPDNKERRSEKISWTVSLIPSLAICEGGGRDGSNLLIVPSSVLVCPYRLDMTYEAQKHFSKTEQYIIHALPSPSYRSFSEVPEGLPRTETLYSLFNWPV